MQSRLQYPGKMPETMWVTAILPATSKWQTGSEMPPWVTQQHGLESAVSDIRLHSSSLADKAHSRAWRHDSHQAIVGQVSAPHQASAVCL